MPVSPGGFGFGATSAAVEAGSFVDPAGSANIGLPNLPPPPKKKKPVVPPITPLPNIVPKPSPVAQSTTDFQNTLAGIVASFEQRLAAASAPPPVGEVTTQPVGFAPPSIGGAAQIIPGGSVPAPVPPPVPPAVPKKVPAQGVTPAAAAAKQRRTAAGAAKARTILTSGKGLLDLETDESQRARKTLLGA